MVEIKKQDDLENWLKTQPKEMSNAISVRAALRALPNCVDLVEEDPGRWSGTLILPMFRALAPPWVAGTWPTQGGEAFISAALSAVRSTLSVAESIEAADSGGLSVLSAPHIASVSAASSAANSAASSAARSAANSAANSAARSAAWALINREAKFIESGATSAELLQLPLWEEGAPEAVMEKWRRLRALLIKQDPNWVVWTDWYEDRLKGFKDVSARPLIPELELERALIPNEDWEKGPTHILQLLAEIEKRYRRGAEQARKD